MKATLTLGSVLVLTLLSPVPAAADLAAGVSAYWEADYAVAESELLAVLNGDADAQERTTAHKYLALTYLAQERDEAARDEFVKLLNLDPEFAPDANEFSPKAAAALTAARAKRHFERGMSFYRAEIYDEAVAAFDETLAIDPAYQMAADFRRLAAAKVAEAEARALAGPCEVERTWGRIDSEKKSCAGFEVSGVLDLPYAADRLILIYGNHHKGLGDCWRLEVFGEDGEVLHTFDDRNYAGDVGPAFSQRWTLIPFEERTTISRVRFYSDDRGGGDYFFLALERDCAE